MGGTETRELTQPRSKEQAGSSRASSWQGTRGTEVEGMEVPLGWRGLDIGADSANCCCFCLASNLVKEFPILIIFN